MDRIKFSINGEPHSVGRETRSDESLLDYLRSRRELRGTKYMCREGGCGACVVAAARPGAPPHAVNSVSESLLDYLRSRRELRGTKYMRREGGCGACVVAAARPGAPPHAVNSVSESLLDYLRSRRELRGTKYMRREGGCGACVVAAARPGAPPHAVNSVSESLLDYLRSRRELRGTKYMRREGGCGACVVAAARPGAPPHAVNSCLVSVTSCQDWEITTVEGVGNRKQGYHPLQTTLAAHHGTQCGHCTPGWVMAMYSLLKSKKGLTMMEIEQSFASNICRCTGYRPILEAFKRFASDSPDRIELLDIEDLNICKKNGKTCRKSKCSESDWCLVEEDDVKKVITEIPLKDGKLWYKVQTVDDIFEVLKNKGDNSYMLVNGNTAKGAYPIDEYPEVLIDISGVNELKGHSIDQNLILGAGSTLTETLQIFESVASSNDEFWYLKKFHEHILFVAHIPVRNLGTVAGNLMTKHKHHDFPSDIFLLLETVGAYLTIVDSSNHQERVTPKGFLKVDMKRKVLLNVLLPPLGHDYKFVSFKIMPRAQNAHAIVNAGFLYKISSAESMVSEARIVYGGLSTKFIHAEETEKFLVGRKLFRNETLQAALKVLNKELVVEENPPEPSVKYRKNLAMNLFYKGLLQLCPKDSITRRYRSGAITLSHTRPVSKSHQDYKTNPIFYPINKPIQKAEGLIQCAGEAPYTEDIPSLPREVFGAFVLATIPLGEIDHIDESEALKHPGVIAFYSAKDIPGVNSFTTGDSIIFLAKEELFCNGHVKYNGQVIGVVVAETRPIAEYAAKLVHVTYKNVKKPVLDVKEAKKDSNRVKKEKEDLNYCEKEFDQGLLNIVKGDVNIYWQYHFCMETLASVAKPTEEGLEVHCTTQHMDGVHVVISRALNIPSHKIDIHVRRLGGGFGVKISRGNQVAVASALVAKKLNRPCRMMLPITTHMKSVGKRLPCSTDYEAAVDLFGKIQYVKENLYMDNGYVIDESLFVYALDSYNNCYSKLRFNYKLHSVLTDTASNTWCRSPGTLEAVASAEFMMERISYELSMDPLALRLLNIDPLHIEIVHLVEKLKKDGEYEKRRKEVNKFNDENRWKKRGLRFSLLRWQPFIPQYIDVNMSVYHDDGTIAIAHGGVEMGQGLNTKAMQIAAYILKVPVEKIQIKGNNSIINPNSFISGGSMTSINIGVGIRRCCEELLLRMAPIKAALPLASWEAQVKAAFLAGIDLQTHGFVTRLDIISLAVLGATLAEVEVDVLTGEWEVLRVDLIEDVGQSVSPEIDVGQIEGGFIMGLGYWTTEHLVHNPNTGELLTDRTWNYHVPQAMDIPQDFRVYFKENLISEPLFFGAKVIGEPSICMAVAVPFAMHEAVSNARKESDIPQNEWFQIDGPYTREALQLKTATKFSDFKFT